MNEYSLVHLDAYVEQLIQLYGCQVHAYALFLTHKNVHDAEDITWEAYERTYIYLRSRPGRQIQKPKNWLFTTVRNIYLNSIRGKEKPLIESLEQLMLSSSLEQGTSPIDIADNTKNQPEREVEDNEDLEEVSRQIAALPEGVIRDAVSLNVLEELSCPEISKQLNRPLGTIKASVHHGKAELRTRLISWKNKGE